MKNRHFVAIILSAVMVLTACMPMSGMAAFYINNHMTVPLEHFLKGCDIYEFERVPFLQN